MFVKYALCTLMIVAPAVFTYRVANYGNRLPTPIDGAWDVVSASQNIVPGDLAEIFFERNRAWMCVFKRKDGSYLQHHFEVDPNKETLTIWEQWREKGNKIFEGIYRLSGDELRVSGKFDKNAEYSTLILRRRKVIAFYRPRKFADVPYDSANALNLPLQKLFFKHLRIVDFDESRSTNL